MKSFTIYEVNSASGSDTAVTHLSDTRDTHPAISTHPAVSLDKSLNS